jgi:hypothetical protein
MGSLEPTASVPAAPVAPQRLRTVRRTIAGLLLASGLLAIGGVAAVSAASPTPSASSAPSGGTTTPGGTHTGTPGANCPGM